MKQNCLAVILVDAYFNNFKFSDAGTIIEEMRILPHSKHFSPGQEEDFVASLPRPTEEVLQQVADATKGQAESEQWHDLRKGRITASRYIMTNLCHDLC